MKKFISLILTLNMIIALLFSAPFTAEATDVPTQPQNGIPLIVVNIDESEEAIAAANASDASHTYGTIEDMNGSNDHSVRCVGDVDISVPDGYVSKYGSSLPEGNLKLKYIRGRGNTSWDENKKPYKIELKNAADLFGMGESTDWALMANAIDESEIKNIITSQLGEGVGMPYTPQSIPVEVVMTGSKTGSQFLGLYYLSETVKVEQSRVDIPKLKKSVADEESITGGYLLSLYTDVQNGDEPESNHFKTASGLEFITKTPEFTSEDLTDGQRSQRAYIQNYIRELDDLIMNHFEIDAKTHAAIAEKLDLRSVADYWWIQEFSNNGDAFATSSTYFYKDRGGKLCFGPLWDFDRAWDYFDYESEEAVSGFNNTVFNWVDELRGKDPLFVELLKERWNDPIDGIKIQLSELTKDGGFIDRDIEEIRSAWEIDSNLWQSDAEVNEEYEEDIYTKDYTLDEHAYMFKSWINARSAWISANLESIDDIFHTLTYKVDGEVFFAQKVRDHSWVFKTPTPPEKDGYVFNGWHKEGTDTNLDSISITEDTTVVPTYVKETKQTLPRTLYLEYTEHWIDINSEKSFFTGTTVMPDTAIRGTLKYTSSNESVAIYSQKENEFIIKGVGDTTITISTRNGVSASMILHVFDGKATPRVELKEIKLNAPKKLEPGEYTQITTKLLPEGQPLKSDLVFFSTDDEDIVEIDIDTGVIKALKPGKATITVKGYSAGYDSPEITQSCEIIVAHTLDNGKITKAPTYTSTGIKSYTCTVCGKVVKKQTLPKKALTAVKTLKCKARTARAQKFVWSAVRGAQGYQIQISNAAGNKWGKVYNAKAKRAFVFKKLAAASNYKFRVRAYAKGTDGKYNYGKWTKIASPTLPAGTAIVKLIAAKNAFAAKWKAGSKANGYQIQYSRSAKFTKAKVLTVKNPKKLSASIDKLGAKKKYYVRIRTYKTFAKKNYFSSWSKTYKVKTK